MMLAKTNSMPIGVATRRVIERIVIHNPHFAPIWLRLDPAAVHALARLGISPSGDLY